MSRAATGSVYRIKAGKQAGRWAAEVTLPDGRRRRRLAATRAEADRARRELLGDVDSGAAVRPHLTVAAFLDAWLEFTAKPSVRPSTLEAYVHKLAMLVPLIGDKRLDKLEPVHLRAAYARLAAKGHPAPAPGRTAKPLSPTTIRVAHTILHAALEQAYRDGLVGRNVAGLVVPPKKVEFAPRPFTRDEALRVLALLREHRYGPLWTFMLGTGCRIGEAAALWWDDVDLARRRVAIRHTLTRRLVRPGVREWQRTPVKTTRSRRVLALPSVVAAALRSQRARNAEARLAAPQWAERGFVFPDTRGGPVRANHVLEAWHAALTRIGLDPRRLHDLRASTATLLFGSGFETRAVADQLGHASTSMTEGRYIGSVPEMLERAAEQLDEILTPDEADEAAE